MITTPAGTSMNLDEAAEFLGLHPNTLQERAKSGEIPGAKIGKCWRFLAERLVEFIKTKEKSCHSTNQTEAPTGGSIYQIPTGDRELENQLSKLTKEQRKESMTKRKRISGRSKLRVVSSTTR